MADIVEAVSPAEGLPYYQVPDTELGPGASFGSGHAWINTGTDGRIHSLFSADVGEEVAGPADRALRQRGDARRRRGPRQVAEGRRAAPACRRRTFPHPPVPPAAHVHAARRDRGRGDRLRAARAGRARGRRDRRLLRRLAPQRLGPPAAPQRLRLRPFARQPAHARHLGRVRQGALRPVRLGGGEPGLGAFADGDPRPRLPTPSPTTWAALRHGRHPAPRRQDGRQGRRDGLPGAARGPGARGHGPAGIRPRLHLPGPRGGRGAGGAAAGRGRRLRGHRRARARGAGRLPGDDARPRHQRGRLLVEGQHAARAGPLRRRARRSPTSRASARTSSAAT